MSHTDSGLTVKSYSRVPINSPALHRFPSKKASLTRSCPPDDLCKPPQNSDDDNAGISPDFIICFQNSDDAASAFVFPLTPPAPFTQRGPITFVYSLNFSFNRGA